MFKTGVAVEVISPVRGLPLAGYFNPRYNKGILDNLHVKTVLFSNGGVTGGIISYDLCFTTTELVEKVKEKLKKEGIDFAGNIIFTATHTHTGPFISDFFSGKKDEKYFNLLLEKTVICVREAFANLSDSELSYGSFKNNPFAYNRRYYMKNGKVLTNPGKKNPDIVKPEGPVDDEISFVTITKEGKINTVIANIVNHTDTIGGDWVSADWPAQMEKAVCDKFGYQVNVITLIGCSGNINHFDVSTKKCQGSYAESKRIGKGYAKLLLENLKGLKKIHDDASFKVDSTMMHLPFRTITEEEERNARDVVSKHTFTIDKDLTSEDLAKGAGAVAYFFAEQLLRFKEKSSGKSREFEVMALKFGKEMAISSFPGEPFTEIGMEVKSKSPFKKTLLVSHSMGKAGYIPMPECFSRGGYEILPVEGGGCRQDSANLFIEIANNLLSKN